MEKAWVREIGGASDEEGTHFGTRQEIAKCLREGLETEIKFGLQQ